ncbi:hypothetical protein R75461_08326 [Paraburkholderia nemoris]|nr:hypothetical protein R75461_08326 [Paraburkholderia nemoris]
MASTLAAFTAPAATLVTATGVPALPSVTLVWAGESYCTASASVPLMVVSELLIVLISDVFCVVRPSMLVRAPPTLLNVLPPML